MAKLNGVTVISEDRIAYGDGGYERVTGSAQVGDIVRVIGGHFMYVDNGGYYEVIDDEYDGLTFEDNVGDTRDDIFDECPEYFAVYRRVEAEETPVQYVTHEGVTYRKEARKAQVGELAVTVANVSHGWPSGVIVKAVQIADIDGYFEGEVKTTLNWCENQYTQYLRHECDYNVLVPVETEPTATPDLTAEIAELERQLAEKKAKLEAEQPKFNVGDYAKTLVAFDVPRGEFVKITEVSGVQYRGEMVNGKEFDWYTASQLEPVSAEDVQKAEDARKWGEIGRKVGEFKKGDVVEVGSMLMGTIIGPVEDLGGNLLGVRLPSGGYCAVNKHSAKLVVPVEKRFDK